MSEGDPDPPKSAMQDEKGRFKPGNKLGKRRVKGQKNKFGPDLRAKLMAGIAAAGDRKARKAGKNGKIDGFDFYLEQLFDTSNAAAATLLAKLIPPEKTPEVSGGRVIVNVHSVAEGQFYSPGHAILLPIEESTKAWQAFRLGPEAWQAYLQDLEPQLTKAAFEKLSAVVAPEPREDNVVPLRLAPPDHEIISRSPDNSEFVPQTETERRLLAKLESLSQDELQEIAERVGYVHRD